MLTGLKGGNMTVLASTHMMEGQHQEGSAPGTLCYHGDEAGVDRAEVVVVDAACDGNAIVAAPSAGRFHPNLLER